MVELQGALEEWTELQFKKYGLKMNIEKTGTYNSLHVEFVSITVVPYYIGHMYRYYT